MPLLIRYCMDQCITLLSQVAGCGLVNTVVSNTVCFRKAYSLTEMQNRTVFKILHIYTSLSPRWFWWHIIERNYQHNNSRKKRLLHKNNSPQSSHYCYACLVGPVSSNGRGVEITVDLQISTAMRSEVQSWINHSRHKMLCSNSSILFVLVLYLKYVENILYSYNYLLTTFIGLL